MIRVNKGPTPPYLQRNGVRNTQRLENAYDANPSAYDAGVKALPVSKNVYGHEEIRIRLAEDQHGKCCYCEVYIEVPYMERDVEHYRPKGSTRQDEESDPIYPGYYWLAYCWENLFLACNVCNRLHKNDLFPVQNPANRALRHTDVTALAAERPLLLRPDGPDDPELHITFVEEQPIALSPQGEETIKVAGLDRLHDPKRDAHITLLRDAVKAIWDWSGDPHQLAQERVRKARIFLEFAVQPQAPFSSMAKAYIRDNPLPP